MNLDARVGQVWDFDESVELIVRGVPPKERITEVRWTTLVLWSEGDHAKRHPAGSLDQAGESTFVGAELVVDAYHDWKRIL